jgi:hypothetical protein
MHLAKRLIAVIAHFGLQMIQQGCTDPQDRSSLRKNQRIEVGHLWDEYYGTTGFSIDEIHTVLKSRSVHSGNAGN